MSTNYIRSMSEIRKANVEGATYFSMVHTANSGFGGPEAL